MVEPRRPSDVRRIVRRVKTDNAEAELREYDKLLAEDVDCDPGLELSSREREEKLKNCFLEYSSCVHRCLRPSFRSFC